MPHRLLLHRWHLPRCPAYLAIPHTAIPHRRILTNPQTLSRIPISPFHSSAHHRATGSDENHYSILESTPGASPAQLKKQFYALSKKYHPDLHPDDPSASARFVRISTAWAVLGNSSKRAAYDRDLARTDPSAFGGSGAGYGAARGGPMPSGSHSSAQAYGARPASGLSKRRGQFRGPPPSFYRSGGWGAQGEKRRSAAEGAKDSADRTAGSAAGGAGASGNAGAGNTMGGGFAPGQGQEHADFEVPHFNRNMHFKRQENVEQGLRKRREMWNGRDAVEREAEQSSVLARVVFVSGALLFTAFMGSVWERSTTKKKTQGLH